MIIGEFGVLRWANGKNKWINDAIELFEKYNFDWCYFSFGGWNGWNPAMKENSKVGLFTLNINDLTYTKELGTLIRYWDKNKKQYR